MDLGQHAYFIWASYCAMALVLAGLALWLWIDGRRYKQALADLERRGVKRKSQSSNT